MRVLGFHHAPDEMHRARHALVKLGKRLRDHLAAGGIVPPSSQISVPSATKACSPPAASRSSRAGHCACVKSVLERAHVERIAEHDAGGGDG